MDKNPQVDEFMNNLEHPFKDEMQKIREIILATDTQMTEAIKWGGPTFMYKGNIATLTPRTKRFVNLFFPTGAVIENRHGILEGDAEQVRVIRFADMNDVEAKEEALQAVVKEWINLKDDAG